MINDILSLIEVATIAINETTILESKVTIRPFRSSLTTYLSRLMKVKESAKSVRHVQSFCFCLLKLLLFISSFPSLSSEKLELARSVTSHNFWICDDSLLQVKKALLLAGRILQ